MFQELASGLYIAQKELSVMPFVKLRGAMFVVKSENGLLFIDPFEMPESDLHLLDAVGMPKAVLLTNQQHLRDAVRYRERYQIPILAHEELRAKLKDRMDESFEDGQELFSGITTHEMHGTLPGETVFHLAGESGSLIAGDALMNIPAPERKWIQRMIGTPEGLGTMPLRFMRDRATAAQTYERLLEQPFDNILVSHGNPVLGGAHEALQAALENTWR